MGSNAITVHLPDKQKQSIIFEIQLEIPVPINGYPQDRRIGIQSKALVDTGATGSCISRRFAADAQLKPFKMGTVIGAHGIAIVPVYRIDVLLPNGILFSNMEVAEFISIFETYTKEAKCILNKNSLLYRARKIEMNELADKVKEIINTATTFYNGFDYQKQFNKNEDIWDFINSISMYVFADYFTVQSYRHYPPFHTPY